VPPLRATYRIQLTPARGFDHAASLVPYLAALGVSHLYLSPIMEAVPGSTHGYDTVDPARVRDELGGEDGLARLVAAVRGAGLGIVVDIVPNHMAAHARNPRWWDVLENGPSSRYAAHFDVDWNGDTRIRLPVLSARYGHVLAAGELQLERRGADVDVVLPGGLRLPLAPRSLGGVLADAARRAGRDDLGFLGDALTALPAPAATDRASVERRHRDRAILRALVRRTLDDDAALAAAVDAELAARAADPAALDALLEQQPYRLAFWRTQRADVGYRRFFDVASLVGVRVEAPHVFDDVHARVLALVRDGAVDGLRVDHVDGLRDPGGYLARLRAAAPAAWIGVEKILADGESLPAGWPIDGTTGYETGEAIGAVLVDPRGEAALTAFAERYTGEAFTAAAEVRRARRETLRHAFGGEVRRLSRLAMALLAGDPRFRDVVDDEVSEALIELLAGYDVYRTYSAAGAPVRAEDVAHIDRAVAAALDHRPDLDRDLLGWLRSVLALGGGSPEADELALVTQQITGAVMAKAVEDTVFYRGVRLLARNEVGAEPARFALDVDDFHARMAAARPGSLIATTTHDSKRGEDVRARLAVLSEIPDTWIAAVERWTARAERLRGGALPDRHAMYVMWQTLVGAWPLDEARLHAYLEKALREAKRVTSWTRIDEAYEQAARDLASAVLADRELLDDVRGFAEALAVPGWRNALTQKLLELTVPGIPDLYQGSELWYLRLVDPDNRGEVDFALRRRLLEAVAGSFAPRAPTALDDDGRAKLWLIRETLALRARRPRCFAGGYHPLPRAGTHAERVIAFVRGEGVIAVAPRWTAALERWADTAVTLPPGEWRCVTGTVHVGTVAVATLLAGFPVALLERTT
jgi:(1->4)-alpha-D-glucan 1-alpha-D-glucosylmutase